MEEIVGPVSTCGRELLRGWWRPIGLMVSFMIFTASVRNILNTPSYCGASSIHKIDLPVSMYMNVVRSKGAGIGFSLYILKLPLFTSGIRTTWPWIPFFRYTCKSHNVNNRCAEYLLKEKSTAVSFGKAGTIFITDQSRWVGRLPEVVTLLIVNLLHSQSTNQDYFVIYSSDCLRSKYVT
jgi:hypothetical protein